MFKLGSEQGPPHRPALLWLWECPRPQGECPRPHSLARPARGRAPGHGCPDNSGHICRVPRGCPVAAPRADAHAEDAVRARKARLADAAGPRTQEQEQEQEQEFKLKA